MSKLTVFNFITLNGCFQGPGGDLSWHRHDEAESAYAAEMLQAGNTLVFGRITYEMMAGYWPTPMALEQAPAVAQGMNKAEKIVFSTTLQQAGWANTTVIAGDIAGEINKRKRVAGKDMTVLGSGTIVTQLAEQGLVDEYQIMIDPVVVGNGTPIFPDIEGRLGLALTNHRIFDSGVVLLCYQPQKP